MALPAVICVKECAHVCNAEPMQNTTSRRRVQSATAWHCHGPHTTHAPHADVIDDRLETLSASTPAPSAPNRHPSSSTAAKHTVNKTGVPKERGERTHQPALPRPDRPARHKVLHDEHVRDDALVVPEREAADRGEHGAAERERVGAQPCQPRGPIRVRVGVVLVAVGVHGERTPAEL